jgi:tRNA (adenine22-N1)-methyltransferase
MKLPLSNRLLACCGFVAPGDRVADIGCDHGYLGIHLLQSGLARSIIAADVNEAPLQSAMRNARKFGVRENMTFYLSDGVRNIPREFDTLVCAGMGADTMMSILSAAPWLKNSRYRLILQCQSKRPDLRRYLYAEGYAIRRETLAKDGKFCYPIMEVVYAPEETLTGAEFYITPALRASASPLLPEFYHRVITGLASSVEGLSRTGGEKYNEYRAILEELLAQVPEPKGDTL